MLEGKTQDARLKTQERKDARRKARDARPEDQKTRRPEDQKTRRPGDLKSYMNFSLF